MAAIINSQLKKDLELLIENQQWPAIKTFFNHWNSVDELVDKVLLFGHFFLSHYLRNESPAFHRILIKKFFSNKNEYTAAPRGFSKTTVNQLCIIFSVVNKMDNFIVLIEKTFNEASEVLKGVRDEFVDNQKILLVYGNLFENIETRVLEKGVKNADSKGDIFINGVRMRAKGFNASIRGLKSREWRPSRIILDDVEDDEHIDNPDQRKKYIDNYNKGVQPAVDIDGVIKMTGTILHQDSLLKNLVESHNGEIFRAYDPADPKNTLLWPERWTYELLEEKRISMASQGLASNAFAQEYLNDPIGDEDRTFKYHWLYEHITTPDNPDLKYRVPAKRITMDQFHSMRKTKVFNGYAMVDVADVTTAGADYTGVMVVFVDQNNNRYKVHVSREKRNVKELIDLIFELWTEWSPYGLNAIGIEKKGFSDQVLPLFDEEKRRRQVYPIIQELKPMGRSKENRIKGALQGLYEMGKMYSVGRIDENGYFQPVGDTMEGLEELYNFPASRNDDLSDAEAYQADMVLVPFGDENAPSYYKDPQMDPFEVQRVHVDNSYEPGFGPSVSYNEEVDWILIYNHMKEEQEQERKESDIPSGLPPRDEILAQALAEVTESRAYVSTKREAFRDRIKLYNNQRRQRDKVGDNSIYNIINTLLAIYYTDEVQVGFVGREFGDVEKASNLENLYKFDHEEMEMDVTNYLVQWDRFFFGVGIKLLAEWNKKTQTPIARTVSPLSWLPDPNGFLMMRNFRYSGFEVEYLDSQLTTKNGFFNLDRLSVLPVLDKSSETEMTREALNEAHNLSDAGDVNRESQRVYKMIDLFTCLNGKKYLLTLNNDCTEIFRAEPIEPVTDEEKENPAIVEFPITLHYYSPDRTDPFGVSIPDLIEDKQRAKSVIKNLRIAVKKADLYPMYLYNRDKILNKRDLDFAFNKFIAVRGDVDGSVTPMNKGITRQNETINEDQMLDRDIEMTTGADKVTQGITSSGQRTASEIQQVTANANLRFILGSRINGWAEKRFAKLWIRLYRQNFSKEKVIRIKSAFGGNNYNVLDRRSIISDTDPDIIVGSKFEIDQDRTKNRVAFSTVYPLIMQDPSKPKVSKTYAERYLMRLYGVSNEEIRIMSPETPDEMLASQENELLSRDKYVDISVENDDHLSHIVIHSQAETSNSRNRHIEAHKLAYINSGQQAADREMARAAAMNGGGQGQDLSRISMNQLSNQNTNLTKNSSTSPVGPATGV